MCLRKINRRELRQKRKLAPLLRLLLESSGDEADFFCIYAKEENLILEILRLRAPRRSSTALRSG